MAMSGPSRIGPMFLRLAAGATLCHAGYQKLFNMDFKQFQDMVNSFGLPYPEILAQVAAWGEFAGGALLILGFVARLAALVNAGTMAVAIWKVKLGPDIVAGIQEQFKETGYQFPLMVLAACLCLLFTGAGALSVDSMLAGRRAPPPA